MIEAPASSCFLFPLRPAPSLSRGTPSLHGPDTPHHMTEDISFLSMLLAYRSSHAGGGPPCRAYPREAACTRPGHSAGLRREELWLTGCSVKGKSEGQSLQLLEQPVASYSSPWREQVQRTEWDSEPGTLCLWLQASSLTPQYLSFLFPQ